MKEVAIFSDLHLGVHNDDELWNNIAIEWCDWFVSQLKLREIKDVLFLGDFFHNRNVISVRTLHVASIVLDKLKDFNLHFILGNHDIYYSDESDYANVSAVNLFSKYPNLTLYTEPTVVMAGEKKDVKCLFCGWGKDVLESDGDVLFTHAEISIFRYNQRVGQCESGYSPTDLLGHYKHIFSGHFHLRQNRKFNGSMIRFVGNPFQMDYSDEDCEKGFEIFNFDTKKVEFVENTKSPIFKKAKLSEFDPNDPDIPNNFFTLIIDREIDEAEISRVQALVDSLHPLTSTLEFEVKKTNKRVLDVEHEDGKEFVIEDEIVNYVHLSGYENEKDILDYLLNIYHETIEENA